VTDGSGRYAREKPFVVEQAAHLAHGVLVRHENLAVELRHVEDRRHVAVVERAQSRHRIAGQRLRRCDDDLGKRLTQALARPHQRSTRSEPGNEHVDTVERLGDLRTGAFVVRARIRLVRVLERHEVTRLAFCELERMAHGPVRPFAAR
jgi:hypothetical protein